MRSSKGAARAAVAIGTLAVLAIPVAVGVSRWGPRGTTLLHALYGGVPVALALGLIAWLCSRRARFALARSVFVERAGPVRLGRFLAYAGLYLGVTGALALAFYAVLQHAQ